MSCNRSQMRSAASRKEPSSPTTSPASRCGSRVSGFADDLEAVASPETRIADLSGALPDQRDAKSARLACHQIAIFGQFPVSEIEIRAVIDDFCACIAGLKTDLDHHPRFGGVLEAVTDQVRKNLIDAELQIGRQCLVDAALGTLLVKPRIEPGDLS